MPGDVETKQGVGRWNVVDGIQPDPLQTRDGKRASDNPSSPDSSPSYYDISMLKPPVWTPEVGVYFFLGGLSAGAFTLARLAERFGGPDYRALTRTGTAIAALAALPCAPLLIKDLGDPKRFHHMLRVWKPGSPMNLGSWALTGYTAMSVLAELREWTRARRKGQPPKGAAKTLDTAVGLATDVLGIPFGLTLTAYTGVLLSTTAVPVWSKNPYIGTLFTASAVSAGAGAIRLTLKARGQATGDDGQPSPAASALHSIESAARVAEAASQIAFVRKAGVLAKPLTQGQYKTQYWGGAIACALILPELLERVPAPSKLRPALRIAAGVASLVGGFALRMAFVAAGRPSANDPEAARQASRHKDGKSSSPPG